MIIGILGLNRRQFNEYCKCRGFRRVTDNEYVDVIDTYINVINIGSIDGRHFDIIRDFDFLRLEVTKRMSNQKNYHFGNATNLF